MRYIYLSEKVRISVLLPGALFLLLVRDVTAAFCITAAVALHELGHLAAGRLLGYRADSFTLGISGADIAYAGIMSYKDDIKTALAGPLVSLAAGALFLPVFSEAALYSIAYGALNAVPVGVFDGGRALRALLLKALPYAAAEKAFAAISFTALFLLYLAGVFLLLYTSCNASLFFLCVYAFAAAVTDKKDGFYV